MKRSARPILFATAIVPLAFLAVGAMLPPQAATPGDHSAAARTHLEAGHVDEAVAEFRQALRLDRNYLPALAGLADVLSAYRRYFEAYAVLQHALNVAPESADIQLLAGRTYFGLKKYPEARDAFRRALQLDPDLTEPHFGLAVIAGERGRLAEARRHIETFIEGMGQAAPILAFQLQGQLALESKDFDGAIQAYRRLLQLEPDPSTESKLAETLLLAGRYPEAEQAYRKLAEQQPDNRGALRGWFEAGYQRGAYDQSRLAMERLARLEPGSCEPPLNLVRVYRMLNRPDRARHHAERCLELVPGHAGAHYALGRVLLSEGELAQAKRHLERSLQARPDNADALYWLAGVELRLDDPAAALAHLEKAAALDPEHAPTRYSLAQTYARQNRSAEARRHLEEFRRLKAAQEWRRPDEEESPEGMPRGALAGPVDADRLQDWTNFARYLLQQGKPRDALAILTEAQRIAPESPEIHQLLADAWTTLGELDHALEAYARAEQLGGNASLYLDRARIYLRLGENDRAEGDLKRALAADLPPTATADAYVLLASLRRREKDYLAAETALAQALRVEPENRPARALLCQTLLDLERAAAAEPVCRKAVEESPDESPPRLALVRALSEQGKLTEAGRELERVARHEGETVPVLLARGRLARARGQTATAIDLLARAGELDPSQADVFHELGLLLARAGRTAEAAVAFEKATIVDPTLDASWIELGKIYLAANRAPAAISYFRRALAAAPENAEAHYQLALALMKTGERAEATRESRQALALGHAEAKHLLEALTGGSPQ